MNTTPTPWRIRSHPDLGSFIEADRPGEAYGREVLMDDDGDYPEREDDIKLIVEAVNLHTKFVEALKRIAKHDGDGMVELCDGDEVGPSGYLSAAKLAQAVLDMRTLK